MAENVEDQSKPPVLCVFHRVKRRQEDEPLPPEVRMNVQVDEAAGPSIGRALGLRALSVWKSPQVSQSSRVLIWN